MQLPNGATVKWMTVTPALAIEWLKCNRGNRDQKRDAKESFVLDMLGSNWLETHQGICFDDQNDLLDGQHRLEAIVASGVPQSFMVFFHWPSAVAGKKTNARQVIDSGTVRTIVDHLKMHHGFKNAAELKRTAAVIGMLCVQRRAKLTLAQILNILELFVDHINFAITHRALAKAFRSANVLGAIAFAHAARPEETEKFYARFTTGANLENGGVVLMLRNFFISDDARKFQLKDSHLRIALAELVLQAVYLDANKKKVLRLEHSTDGLKWFCELQSERVERVAKLFALPAKTEVSAQRSEVSGKNGTNAVERPTLDAIIQKVEMLYQCGRDIFMGRGEDIDIAYTRAAAMTAALLAGHSEAMVSQKFKRSIDYVREAVGKFKTRCSNRQDSSFKKKNERFGKLCAGLGLAPGLAQNSNNSVKPPEAK
jgi:hypothetical protein